MPQRIPGYDSARMLTNMAEFCSYGVRCGNVWTGEYYTQYSNAQ